MPWAFWLRTSHTSVWVPPDAPPKLTLRQACVSSCGLAERHNGYSSAKRTGISSARCLRTSPNLTKFWFLFYSPKSGDFREPFPGLQPQQQSVTDENRAEQRFSLTPASSFLQNKWYQYTSKRPGLVSNLWSYTDLTYCDLNAKIRCCSCLCSNRSAVLTDLQTRRNQKVTNTS